MNRQEQKKDQSLDKSVRTTKKTFDNDAYRQSVARLWGGTQPPAPSATPSDQYVPTPPDGDTDQSRMEVVRTVLSQAGKDVGTMIGGGKSPDHLIGMGQEVANAMARYDKLRREYGQNARQRMEWSVRQMLKDMEQKNRLQLMDQKQQNAEDLLLKRRLMDANTSTSTESTRQSQTDGTRSQTDWQTGNTLPKPKKRKDESPFVR